MIPTPVTTARLVIDVLTVDDAATVAAYRSDPDVAGRGAVRREQAADRWPQPVAEPEVDEALRRHRRSVASAGRRAGGGRPVRPTPAAPRAGALSRGRDPRRRDHRGRGRGHRLRRAPPPGRGRPPRPPADRGRAAGWRHVGPGGRAGRPGADHPRPDEAGHGLGSAVQPAPGRLAVAHRLAPDRQPAHCHDGGAAARVPLDGRGRRAGRPGGGVARPRRAGRSGAHARRA